MKKFICLFTILLFLGSVATPPPQAPAAIGIFKLDGKQALVGGATSVAGGAAMTGGFVVSLAGAMSGQATATAAIMAIGGGIVMWIGIVAIPIGLIILDDDGTPIFSYQSLEFEAAEALGLNLEEKRAFNTHLPAFNAIIEELWDLDPKSDFGAIWLAYADELQWDETTRIALAKVSSKILNAEL